MVYTENMEQKNAQQIKLTFGEEIRRLSFTGTSFQMLVEDVKRLFNLKDEFNPIIKYLDDDKDLITMSSDEELNTAMKLASGNLLRIQISRRFAKRTKSSEPENPFSGKEEKGESVEVPKEVTDKHAWRERREKIRQFKETFHAMQQVRLVKDVTFADNSSLAPLTQFVKTWKIRNESKATWPEGCSLTFHKGDMLGGPSSIPVPPLAPGQELDLSITLTAPSTFGKYCGVWRLTTPSFTNWKGESVQKKFGTPLKVKICVSDSSSEKSSDSSSSSSESEGTSDEEKLAKEEKKQKKEAKQARKEEKRKNKELKKKAKVEEMAPLLLQLETMGFTNKQLNLRILYKTHGDLDKAVVKLLKKKNKAQRK